MKELSRQRRWQLEHKKAGLCQKCSEPAWLGGAYCKKHANWKGAGNKLKRRIAWSELDWSRPTVEIAKEMGVVWGGAHYWRRKLGKMDRK